MYTCINHQYKINVVLTNTIHNLWLNFNEYYIHIYIVITMPVRCSPLYYIYLRVICIPILVGIYSFMRSHRRVFIIIIILNTGALTTHGCIKLY